MDMDSKQIQLTNLELALEDLDKIIDNMKKNNYSKEELNEYVKKRWNVWNEIHQVKKS
jgi:DNA-binding transcriptional regulator YhcF (GntR family)